MEFAVKGTLFAAALALATLAAMRPADMQDIAYGNPADEARYCGSITDDRVVGRAPCESLAGPR